MRRYMKYGGDKEQQARQDMENCPIMPYLVIAFIVGCMQFDSGVCGQDKHGNQTPVYYKNLFHLSFGFNRCGKVRIFDWNRTITNVKKTFNKGTVNEKKALNGINLHLAPGDFVTIIAETVLENPPC